MNVEKADLNPDAVSVKIKIRRFDNSESNDLQIIEKSVLLDTNSEYNTLKKQLHEICQVGPEDNKVIKLRRDDEVLVPLMFLLETHDPKRFFYVDICKINYTNKATASLLQDAYIDSVCQKLRNMESRVVKAEMLLPQLEWRREAHMEDTANILSNKVAFLDRRLDQLMPEQWRSKMPQTIA